MKFTKFALNLATLAALGLSPLVAQANTPAPATPVASSALPPATLVKDINTATTSAFDYGSEAFITSPNYAYFVATDDNQTISAWRTGGAANNTLKIPHIAGTKSTPDTIEVAGTIGDKALITVSDWTLVDYYYVRTSQNVWITDGTDAGTKIIKENIGATDVITLHNNNYFIDTGTSGLWQVDPTTGNVTLAVAFGGTTQAHFVLNDVLYYIGGPAGAVELWRTDGTQQGTQPLAVLGGFSALNAQPAGVSASTVPNEVLKQNKAIHTTDSGVKPAFGMPPPPLTPKFAAIGNTVYVRLNTSLFKSNGTPAGTTLVSNQLGGENSYDQSPMLTLGNKLFFYAYNGVAPAELWSSDGTTQGTGPFKDIAAGSVTPNLHLFATVGGQFFFRANDQVHGEKLWRSDGTVDGTQIITDSLSTDYAAPDELVAFNNKAYYVAYDSQHGRQVWVTDGTPAGTQRISDITTSEPIAYGPTNLTAFGPHLLFTADSATTGRELWISDGTVAGTHLLKDINTTSAGSNLSFLAATLDKTFFVAYESAHGRSVWASDGNADNTQFLFDLPNTEMPADVGYIGTVGNNAYFFNHGNTDNIWRTDGTITNTKLITQFVGNATLFSYPAVAFNNQIFVRAGFSTLYRIDPSQNDAVIKVKDFAGALPYDGFIVSGGSLWIYEFPLIASSPSPQLWRSDGSDGVTLIHTFENIGETPDVYFLPPKIGSLNGNTYFSHYGTSDGLAFLKTDGTPAGTSVVKVISDSAGISVATGIVTASQHIYVASGFDASGQSCRSMCDHHQLWQSDGTLTGTVLLTTTPSGNNFLTSLSFLGTLSNSVIFTVKALNGQTGANNFSLWRVNDNTSAIEPLTNATFDTFDVSQVRIINGLMYFRGNQNQLWQTDGTPTGTKLTHQFNFSTTLGGKGIQLLQPLHNGLLVGVFDQTWSLWYETGGQVTQLLIQPQLVGDPLVSPPNVQTFSDTVLFSGYTQQYGNELWRLDLTDTHNLSVQTVTTQPVTPASSNTIPIIIFSERFGQVTSATLTATLPVSVTYITDTLGISPTLNGNSVVWQISNLAFGARDFNLSLAIPNAALGTRYPITFTIGSSLTDTVVADNIATTNIWLTAQTFLPLSFR